MAFLFLVFALVIGCEPAAEPAPGPTPEQARLRAQGAALYQRVGWTWQWRDAGRLAHQLTQRHGALSEELDAVAIPRGAVVADIGAGLGWYTFPIAHAVGPEGRVIALDIQPEAVALLAVRAREARLNPWGTVEARQSRVDDCGLPEASIDVAFMAHLGFYLLPELLDENVRMLQSVLRALKPGGRLEVLEYLPPGKTEGPMIVHLQEAGFVLDKKEFFEPHHTWHCAFRRPGGPVRGD